MFELVGDGRGENVATSQRCNILTVPLVPACKNPSAVSFDGQQVEQMTWMILLLLFRASKIFGCF